VWNEELALQRVEAQTSLLLSRQISTPNIASKGKPEPRQALVPGSLYPPGHPHYKSGTKAIQELDAPTVTPSALGLKGILKGSSNTHTPTWTWKKVQNRICIVINVPNVVSSLPLAFPYPRRFAPASILVRVSC